MKDKRLVILLWLTNEHYNQTVIAQVNVKLRVLNYGQKTPIEEDLIIGNMRVGKFHGDLTYTVIDADTSKQKHSKETRKWSDSKKGLTSMVRKHSA